MENDNRFTSDQKRFFSDSQSNQGLTPATLFLVVLGAILSAWVIIQMIEYIQVQSALHKLELEAKSMESKVQQTELDAHRKANAAIDASKQHIQQSLQSLSTTVPKSQEKRKVRGQIIHVNQE